MTNIMTTMITYRTPFLYVRTIHVIGLMKLNPKQQTCQLIHYHTILHFDTLKIYSCGKHYEKGEIACNKLFLLFSQCFLTYMALIFHLKCTHYEQFLLFPQCFLTFLPFSSNFAIVVCKLFQFGRA